MFLTSPKTLPYRENTPLSLHSLAEIWQFVWFALILHPKSEVDRFEQLATTVKNAKLTAFRCCVHSLLTIPVFN